MTNTAHLILDHTQISHKIRRITFQIYESHVNEDHIVLAGIMENGYILADRLKEELERISDIKVSLCEVHINKKRPLDPVRTSLKPDEYRNKSVVLVDDVLNSGTTLIYGVRHFLEVPLKKFKTAVLVDRSHKKYPVKADFKGLSLSTSLSETVNVSFQKDNDSAYLG